MLSSKDMVSAVAVSRGASYLTIQTVVTTVAQVLAFAVLARIITPAEVGILAVLTLITNLTQAVNGAVFQQAAMKYVGEYAGADESLAAGVFQQTFQVSIIISVPIAGLIFLDSGLLARWLLGAAYQAELFRVLAVDVLVFAGALPVALGVLLGAKRFKEAAAIGTGGAVLRQCLIILLILLLKNFIGLVYGWVLSDFTLFAAYGVYGVRVLGRPKNPFPLRKLLSFSWPLGVGNAVSFAYGWFDRAILIVFVPLASLGVYNAALMAYGILLGISGAFGNALLPIYSNMFGRGVLESCRRATRLASRYVSLVMVPLGFGLLATAEPALTLFVGKAYVGGAVPLAIFSLAFALTAFGLALGPVLTALAKTREVLLIIVASTVIALACAYVLMPFLGIVGASVARGIATVASTALTILVLKRIGVMSVDVEMAWKTLVAGVVMAGVLIAVQMVVYSRILLPAYVLLGAIVYVILLRVLNAVRDHDIELIERYLGARLGFVGRLLGVILINRVAVPKPVDPPSSN
jgi:O-antigen/teichoic acid export membrane protein